MSWLSPAYSALYGAYRLARFDAQGLRWFDVSPAAFWYSFLAAGFVAPLYATLMVTRFQTMPVPVSGLRFFVVELIAYSIAWTAFPVAMATVVKMLDRERHYIRCIIAYNWAAVLQNLLYLPISILSISGVLGGGGGSLLGLVALLAILIYSWFVLKTTLEVPPAVAWVLVALDLLISMIISLWSDALLV